MPPLPSAPGVLKVTTRLVVGSDNTALNRFFIHYSGTAPTPAEVTTFCGAVSTAWNTDIAPQATADRFLVGVDAEDLSSASGAVGTDGTVHAGTLAHNALPGGTCFMTQFLIARRYRGGKPKIFLPLGGAQDIAVGLNWAPGSVTNFETAWTSFIAAVLASGWTGAGTLTHVNVSYYNGFTVVTNPITHRAKNVPTLRGAPLVDLVVGYSAENGIASQRRRNVV